MGDYNPPHECLKMVYDGKHFKAGISTVARPNQVINFLIDSGSCNNLIRVNMLGIAGAPTINYDNKIIITGIGGNDIQTLGSVIINLKIGKTVYKTKFQVLRDLVCPAILGSEFLKQNTLYISQEFEYIVKNENLGIKDNNSGNQGNMVLCNDELKHTRNTNQYILSTGANRIINDSINNSNFSEINNFNKINDFTVNENFIADEIMSKDDEFEIGHTVVEIHHDENSIAEVACEEQIHYPENKSTNMLDYPAMNSMTKNEYFNEEYDEMSLPEEELNLDYDRDCDVVDQKKFRKLKGYERTCRLFELVKINHLNDILHNEVEDIIEQYKDIFYLEGDDLTCTKMAIHDIETTTNIPINKRQYRFPEATKVHIDE